MDDPISEAERHWRGIAKPPPERRARIRVEDRYSIEEAECLLATVLPEVMEDKWLVLHDDGTLNFYRSWSGFHVYALEFVPAGEAGEYAPGYAWASREPAEYTQTDDARDAEILRWLVRALVLRQHLPYPTDPTLPPDEAALAAWASAGNASVGILPGEVGLRATLAKEGDEPHGGGESDAHGEPSTGDGGGRRPSD